MECIRIFRYLKNVLKAALRKGGVPPTSGCCVPSLLPLQCGMPSVCFLVLLQGRIGYGSGDVSKSTEQSLALKTPLQLWNQQRTGGQGEKSPISLSSVRQEKGAACHDRPGRMNE